MKLAVKNTRRSVKKAAPAGQKRTGFTEEERAAMKERLEEMKAEESAGSDEVAAVLAKIAALPEPDRAMAERLHALIRAVAPGLSPRTWYGMPAYAKDGQVVRFFQSAQKFKTRYATLGFSDKAKLDDGSMWPTAYALKEWTSEGEARVRELVRRAVG